MRTRVKFCGLTNQNDVAAAIDAGADALGFNLYPESSRYVMPGERAILTSSMPPFVSKVGLFVNATREDVLAACDEMSLDLLQFHGDETESCCTAYDLPYIKAIRVASAVDIEQAAYNFPTARALLLDADVAGQFGGTGATFDWRLVKGFRQPVILAGGLTPQNVAEAIRVVRPFAVDVSSGIERAKGQKDHSLMNTFVAAVCAADGEF